MITDVLVLVGGFTVVLHMLTLAWRCWCGFRTYVLSELWQVDLRTYGKWAVDVGVHPLDIASHRGGDGSTVTDTEGHIGTAIPAPIFLQLIIQAPTPNEELYYDLYTLCIVVVTGATSGIGKAYASELARRGLDVVLVSRCDDKLQRVAQQIEDQYGGETRTIRVDFTEGHSIYPSIAQGLRGLEIGILVNNVGMPYSDYFAYFLETPNAEQKITQIVNCNMLSVPQMTRLVLPDMVERGRGLIINISSGVGIHPQPLLTLYSATKIFVTCFSKCLHAEYKSKGITVQCVTPFLVSTNMTRNMRVNCFMKSASGFVRDALNTVGHSGQTCGCLSHALQNLAFTIFLPEWLRMSRVIIRKLVKAD